MKRKNIAIILAGGDGVRAGYSIAKQFIKLAGKTVLEHSISVFEKNDSIDNIAIVTKNEYFDKVQEIITSNNFIKCKKILQSGTERYHSTLSAIKAYEQDENINLIIHDAVRPLISDRIIYDCIKSLEKYSAVDVAIVNDDTVIEVDGDLLKNIPQRDKFWRGQTPQCFHLEVIKKAYEIALKDPNFKTTDDCKVVNYYMPEIKTKIVNGDKSNMKLTYMEDLYMLENFFQLKMLEEKIDVPLEQLDGKTIVIFGGTSGIGLSIYNIAKEYGANVFAFSRKNGVDISDNSSVANAFLKIKQPIDAVIVTAAVLKKQSLHAMTYDDIKEVVNTNYLGSLICAKEAYPYLSKTNGTLLLFSSSSYTKGRSFYAPYSSSKAAIVNITQALAEEWGPINIRVNCINAERTNTPMRTGAFGYEDSKTLLSADVVAEKTLKSIFTKYSGQVISIKNDEILRGK